jgi:Flp pilus assembly pilin Flp
MSLLRLWPLLRALHRLRHDQRGQDMVEYSVLILMVTFVVYGWLPTTYAPSLSTIWGRVASVMVTLTGVS